MRGGRAYLRGKYVVGEITKVRFSGTQEQGGFHLILNSSGSISCFELASHPVSVQDRLIRS